MEGDKNDIYGRIVGIKIEGIEKTTVRILIAVGTPEGVAPA